MRKSVYENVPQAPNNYPELDTSGFEKARAKSRGPKYLEKPAGTGTKKITTTDGLNQVMVNTFPKY